MYLNLGVGKTSKWPQISCLFDFKPQAFLSLQLAVIQLHVWKDENYKMCNFWLCLCILKYEVAIVLFTEMGK